MHIQVACEFTEKSHDWFRRV